MSAREILGRVYTDGGAFDLVYMTREEIDANDRARAARRAPRDRQAMQLRLASPKRADAGRVMQDQADARHLPLFIAANEPRLL